MCYHKHHLLVDNSQSTKLILNEGKKVSKVLNDAKPILEATLVSIILVGTAEVCLPRSYTRRYKAINRNQTIPKPNIIMNLATVGKGDIFLGTTIASYHRTSTLARPAD